MPLLTGKYRLEAILRRSNDKGTMRPANMTELEHSEPPLQDVAKRASSLFAPFWMFKEVFNHRFLVRNLIRRDVRGRYRNAMLGYAWALIEPALFALVYWFLFIMLSGNPDEMYAVWVLIGVVVWGCFGKSLSATTNSLVGNARTMHLVYFPRVIFPITAVGANFVVTLMSSLVIIPILMVYDLPITMHLFWVPVGIFLAGIMALGFGMMVAPLNCVQRDVGHFMRFVVRAGFFVSPVMWTAEMAAQRGAWGEAALYNPVVLPITMVRHALEGKSVDLPPEVILSSLTITCVLLVTGAMVFARLERGAVKYL